MKTLNVLPGGKSAELLTLDSLWETAAKFGRVEVDDRWGGSYEVQIRFKVGGSVIWARGEDSDIKTAFVKAIDAAKRLASA